MDSRSRLILECTGVSLDELQAMDQEQIEKIRLSKRRWQAFDNACKDFITIVLSTETIAANEDYIRVRLIGIVHLLESVIQHAIVTFSDADFERKCQHGIKPLASLVVRLLRKTMSDISSTEAARRAWLPYDSRYGDSLQTHFQEIVDATRIEYKAIADS